MGVTIKKVWDEIHRIQSEYWLKRTTHAFVTKRCGIEIDNNYDYTLFSTDTMIEYSQLVDGYNIYPGREVVKGAYAYVNGSHFGVFREKNTKKTFCEELKKSYITLEDWKKSEFKEDNNDMPKQKKDSANTESEQRRTSIPPDASNRVICYRPESNIEGNRVSED